MSESALGSRPVLQKLLTHGLDTPDRLLSAYGFEGGQEFVDVVRFELPRLPTLTHPVAPDARRWVGVP